MKLEKFTGAGSTEARRRFWNNVADTVISLTKKPGKNVSVTEDYSGSLIDVNPQRQGQSAPDTCPSTVFVQFSGIQFDCGCTFFTPALTTSFTVEDEGNVNSLTSLLSLGPHASPLCGDCIVSGNASFWEGTLSVGSVPDLYIDFWNNTDCSGPPDEHHFQELVFPVLILLSGTYYLFAFIQSTDTLIFYATSSSLSGPFNNVLSCNPNYVSFSDPAITCFNNGSPRDFNVIAHGGSATIAF